MPGLKRHALIDAFRKGLGIEEPWNSCISAYPLVTIAAAQSVDEYPTCLRESLAREVAVPRIGDLAEAHAAVLEAACKGAAVALIPNTVDEAVASYAELASAYDGEALLFHARFAMADRLGIEERVLARVLRGANECAGDHSVSASHNRSLAPRHQTSRSEASIAMEPNETDRKPLPAISSHPPSVA